MYLSVNILFTVLIYLFVTKLNCKSVEAITHRLDKNADHLFNNLSSENYDFEKPLPVLKISRYHQKLPIRDGHLYVEHTRLFKLECPKDKFIAIAEKEHAKNAKNKPVATQQVEFEGEMYELEDEEVDSTDLSEVKKNQGMRKTLPRKKRDAPSIEYDGKRDCVLTRPRNNTIRMPDAREFGPDGNPLLPDDYGNIYVKHNDKFTLSCGGSSRFTEEELRRQNELDVTCLDSHLDIDGDTYDFEDFECDDEDLSEQAMWELEDEYIPSTTPKPDFTELDKPPSHLDPNTLECFFFIPKINDYTPIPMLGNQSIPSVLKIDIRRYLYLKQEEYLELSCPGHYFERPVRPGNTEITVKCLNRTFVEYNGKAYRYRDFRCVRPPVPKMISTQNPCQGLNNRILNVGFNIRYKNHKKPRKLLELYRICFSDKHKQNVYSWYTVKPPHHETRQFIDRNPDFYKTPNYERMDIVRTYARQAKTLETLLCSRELAHWYISQGSTDNKYLTRGRVLDKYGFQYGFQTTATYYYENTVPMWKTFCEGTWRDLVKTIYRNIARTNTEHLLVTGPHGVITLPDRNNRHKAVYLGTSKRLAVPEFMWLMDHDLETKNTLVYVAMNHQHRAINNTAFLCNPTLPCPGVRQKPMKPGASSELVYCCSKEGFENSYGKLDDVVYEPFNQHWLSN